MPQSGGTCPPGQICTQAIKPPPGEDDTEAPQISIGGVVSGSSVNVTVSWRDNVALLTTTRQLTFNGTDVTNRFSFSSVSSTEEVGVATLSLVPGTNTLVARICDTSMNCWTTQASWTYTAPDLTPPTISFTPNGGTYTSSTLAVSIQWADDRSLDGGSRSLTLNGTVVTGSFSYTGGATSASSAGTISLVPGTNTLSARICDIARNCTTSQASWTYSVPNQPPVARFTATPNPAAYNQPVMLDGRGSSDPDGDALTYLWDYGTGYTGSEPVVYPVWGAVGSWRVTLTVTDSKGASHSTAQTITTTNQPPTACFTLSVSTLSTADSVTADAACSNDPEGGALSLSFDWGDGTTGPGPQASHRYAAPGSYRVHLTATDPLGTSATLSRNVSVTPSSAGSQLPPVIDVASVNAGTTRARDLCVRIALPGDAASQCGDLVLAHALPSTRTYNQARTPMLLYTSQTAQPYPLVAANVTLPAGAALVDWVEAVLRVRGNERARVRYSGSQWAPGETRRIVLGYDALSDSTDVYAYTLEVIHGYGTTTKTATASGEFTVVNRASSPFGAGWWLAGLEWIKVLPGNHRLWVGGDGSSLIYRYDGATNTWIAPQLAGIPDTIYNAFGSVPGESDVYYLRSLKDGAQIWYDGGGRQIGTRSRLGHITLFSYTSEGPNGSASLKTLSLPVPGTTRPTYTFSYSGGRLLTVSAPPVGSTARTVGVTNVSGRITQIQDPDLKAVQFGYTSTAGPNRITDRTDRRGTRVQYSYRGTGLVEWAHLYMQGTGADIHLSVTPAEDRGSGGTSVAPSGVYTLINGPRTDVGDTTSIWTNRFGAPEKIRDAVGRETEIARGNLSFPALVTRVIAPSDSFNNLPARLTTEAFYNARGNVDSTRVQNPLGDGGRALTRYIYGDTVHWRDFPTQIIDPEDRITRMEYVPPGRAGQGNLAWREDGRGATTRVTFEYGNVHGLLSSTRMPSGARDSLTYDAWGNLEASRTPLGHWTRYSNDAIGRTWKVSLPITATEAEMRETWYSIMDRDTLVLSQAGAMPIGGCVGCVGGGLVPAEWSRIHKTYDDEGNLDYVMVETEPSVISAAETSYAYDRAGRRTAEANLADLTNRFWAYDAAGNVVEQRDSGPLRLTMRYDALNRITERIEQERSYAAAARRVESTGIPSSPYLALTGMHPEPAYGYWQYTFPLYPNTSTGGLVLAADTARFRYHPGSGLLAGADNRWARISRSYYPNGQLRTDSLNIRESSDTTRGRWMRLPDSPDSVFVELPAPVFASHLYGQSYTYDRSGRRRTLTLPAVAGGGVQQWSYDAAGLLEGVLDQAGNGYTFGYDADGLLRSVLYPGGVSETYRYDADGRQTSRRGTLRGDSLEYDARGKVLTLRGLFDQETHWYSGLGTLVASEYGPFNRPKHVEEWRSDPLGRVYWSRQRRNDAGYDAPERLQIHSSGRLVTRCTALPRTTGGAPSPGVPCPSALAVNQAGLPRDTTYVHYDRAGNTTASGFFRDEGPNWHWNATNHYYDASGRLRVLQRYDWVGGHFESSASPRDGTFEEYRYDALGRRVWLRSRRDSLCSGQSGSACASVVERYVWDGDQLLLEIRAPGGESATPQQMESDNGSGEAYGRVVYTHAGGIDAPLGIHRSGASPAFVVPHANYRGMYDLGTDALGRRVECAGGFGSQGCVIWPAQYYGMYGSGGREEGTWIGSLVRGQRDASGLMYRRNRYYDPETGRFTQQDPIGLAGGLNLYGYAGGDPVNFSDPFGLMAECPACDVLNGWAAALLSAERRSAEKAGLSVDEYRVQHSIDLVLGFSGGGSQIHHIGTNKNFISAARGGPWSPKFVRIFERAGMNLDDAANKVFVPGHMGPHPEAYHRIVHQRLLSATRKLTGSEYRDALVAELRAIARDAVTENNTLNRLLTNK